MVPSSRGRRVSNSGFTGPDDFQFVPARTGDEPEPEDVLEPEPEPEVMLEPEPEPGVVPLSYP